MKQFRLFLKPSVCLTVVMLGVASGVMAQKAERSNIREGNKLYKNEKYTEAEIAYRKGLEVNPRSVEGTYDLGNALYKQKKFPEAMEQYQLLLGQAERMMEAEEGAQKLANVFHNIGNISMSNKEYDKAVEGYKQSLRLNPSDDETRYNLALAQKLLEQQQQDQQDQDQNQDQQDQNKDQNQDQNKDQQQQQDQQQNDQDNQKDNKTQEQQQQNEQMSKDNAQQMLDAFLQDEKNTQEKVKKAQAQQQQRRKSDKEW